MRKRRHPDDRQSHRKSIYGEVATDLWCEGQMRGEDPDTIVNAHLRLYPDHKQSEEYIANLRRSVQLKSLFPEIREEVLAEFKELLDAHMINEDVQYEIFRWVAPRLRRRVGQKLNPPETKVCSRCDYELPYSIEYWAINKRGAEAGKAEQPCRWCRSKFWNRGKRCSGSS
jgi:hypothetical protein